MADSGHNVTFISLEKGSLENLNHPNITGNIIMSDTFWEKGTSKGIMNDLCVVPVSQEFSDHIIEDILRLQGCVDFWCILPVYVEYMRFLCTQNYVI